MCVRGKINYATKNPRRQVEQPEALQEVYFAGPKAKTFDQVPRERKFKDPAGMTRFEGSDDQASSPIKTMSDYYALLRQPGPRMEGDPAATLSGTTVPLGDLLTHEEMYRDYPQLRDTPVFVKPPNEYSGTAASYSDAAALASDRGGTLMFNEIANPNAFTGKYNINNEQDMESVYNDVFNSPTGAFTIDNPEGPHFVPSYLQGDEINPDSDFADTFVRLLIHEAQHGLNSIDKTDKYGSTPEEYESRPTEMEAYFTADRLKMTPEQRAIDAPYMNLLFGQTAKYASGGSVAPNRGQAYQGARKAEGPQKGLSYPELLVDNIVGLDNEYLSYGEKFGQAFNEDELGTLKNVAIGAYEGAKKAVTEPVETAQDLLSGIANSVSNLATEDLDARLTRMYGVGYKDATGEQVNKAREAVLGDALTAAELIPLGAVAKKGADIAGEAVDSAQMAQSKRFFDRNNPSVKLSGVANSQFYYPSPGESMMQRSNATPEEQRYLEARQKAEDMLASGKDASSILYGTRMLPVPLKTPLGEDFGTRMMAAMSPDEMAAIRPERASNYGISIVDEKIDGGARGYFRGTIGKGAKIGLSDKLDPQERTLVLRHELAHGDQEFSKLDPRNLEGGASPKTVAKNKAAILGILDAKIKNTSDKGLAGYYKDLRKNLRKTTAYELYQLNPGEMLARLSQGSTKTAKRLSPVETLNPYIRRSGKPLAKRGIEALQTAFRSETNPVISRILQARPDLAEKIARDYYTLVPTDISKAVVTDSLYRPRNPGQTKNKSPKSSARDSSK